MDNDFKSVQKRHTLLYLFTILLGAFGIWVSFQNPFDEFPKPVFIICIIYAIIGIVGLIYNIYSYIKYKKDDFNW